LSWFTVKWKNGNRVIVEVARIVIGDKESIENAIDMESIASVNGEQIVFDDYWLDDDLL